MEKDRGFHNNPHHHHRHHPLDDLEIEEDLSFERLNSFIKSQLKFFILGNYDKDKNKGHDEKKCRQSSTKSTNTPNKSKAKLKYHFLRFLETLLCGLFLIALSPVFLSLLALNFSLRTLVDLYLGWSTKGGVKLMRGQDGFWGTECQGNPGNFTCLYVIEGMADLEKIRRRLKSAWVERRDKAGNPLFLKLKLKATQRFSYFCWEYHESFNISEHVRYLDPLNSHKLIKESDLFDEMGRIYDPFLPSDKPQWEVLVVPNYKYDGRGITKGRQHYALVFRVHHSFMDGLSAAQGLRLVLADNIVEAGLDPMGPLPKMSLGARFALNCVALAHIGPYILRNAYAQKEHNPFHGGELKGPKSLGWSKPIRLSSLKKLRSFYSQNTTQLFSHAVDGAFQTLAKEKGLSLPIKKLTAVTCAAMLPYPNIKAQNRFCVVFKPLKPSKFKRYLHAMDEIAEVLMAFWITQIGGTLPIPLLNFLQYRICQGTILLSNLPGPKGTVRIFGGDPIVDMVGWSPIRNRIGVGMCMSGYNERVRVNVVADKVAFPGGTKDLQRFIKGFEQELERMGRNAGVKQDELFEDEGFDQPINLYKDLNKDTISEEILVNGNGIQKSVDASNGFRHRHNRFSS